MTPQIPHLAIEFTVQTAFLFVCLWILIKLQMLHWNFFAMLGTSALVTALDMLPFGHYISFVALVICVWKLARPDFFTDVIFTLGISYALMFCLNLFVLAALMPDLRYHSFKTELAIFRFEVRANTPAAAATKTNSPPATNTPAPAPVPVPAPAPAPVTTNPPATPVIAAAPVPVAAPAPAAPATNAPDPAAVLRAVTAKFSLKGVSKGVNQQLATVYTGVRIYTIALGETVDMVTSNGRLPVRCEELGENKAVLSVDGQQVTLFVMH